MGRHRNGFLNGEPIPPEYILAAEAIPRLDPLQATVVALANNKGVSQRTSRPSDPYLQEKGGQLIMSTRKVDSALSHLGYSILVGGHMAQNEHCCVPVLTGKSARSNAVVQPALHAVYLPVVP
jgi:hypothetical protein